MAHELPELLVPDANAWQDWLDQHHGGSDGVRLVLARKGTSEPTSITYPQALDEALCYGWIDGQVSGRDEHTYRQRFTPRRARSQWSARNRDHVARLTAAGRMRPAGQAAVDAATADGRWDAAYAGPATSRVPADLAAALADNSVAGAAFEGLTSQNRYAILYRLQTAKRAETRSRRLQEYIGMLERGQTFHPQRPRRT